MLVFIVLNAFFLVDRLLALSSLSGFVGSFLFYGRRQWPSVPRIGTFIKAMLGLVFLWLHNQFFVMSGVSWRSAFYFYNEDIVLVSKCFRVDGMRFRIIYLDLLHIICENLFFCLFPGISKRRLSI